MDVFIVVAVLGVVIVLALYLYARRKQAGSGSPPRRFGSGTTPGFGFRLRFLLDPRTRLKHDEPELKLSVGEDNPPFYLQAYGGDQAISNTDHLVLGSEGFQIQERATQIGEQARQALLWCGLTGSFGLDLGDEPPTFQFFRPFKEQFAERTGSQLREDIHGLQVYDCSLPTRFGRVDAQPVVKKNLDTFLATFRRYHEVGPDLTDQEAAALELAGVAYFEKSPRARFLTRMIAV